MSIQYNPFKENRAEQMHELWKYYVPFPGFLDNAGKPIVVEGGRGSGKTMIFKCNSWKEKLAEIKKNGCSFADLFDKNRFIGIYYRVDTPFVSLMNGRAENWDSIFQTYFTVCILEDLLELITIANTELQIDGLRLSSFVKIFSEKLFPENSTDSISDFLRLTDKCLDYIENIVNGESCEALMKPRYVIANRFIADVCIEFNKLIDRDIVFKIFIDEYETLQIEQQKIINTLIKHSTIPVIYNIGLKPKGMKTNKTVSETEIIESPHDYEEIALAIDTDEYKKILREICIKRIVLGKEKEAIPECARNDIEFYLGQYSIEYEMSKIKKDNTEMLNMIAELKELIKARATEDNASEKQIMDYITELCDDAPILNKRLHYALICTKTTSTPSIEELFDAYKNNSKRYQDWIHNRKMGILFLLMKESKLEKMYFGFDVFAALSSNVVRYFLELCEQAFRFGSLETFDWSMPLLPEIQDEAAKYVSKYKIVRDVPTYPFGKELRIFVQYLGKIFYRLHTDKKSTVGEPEPNHFSTRDLSLTDQLRSVLSSAIMWNVLQEGEPTKRKQSKLSPETTDYYLNKIYAPYFNISYRNKRKIQLDISLLENLMSGNEKNAEKAYDLYFRDSPDMEDKQMNLFEKENMQ